MVYFTNHGFPALLPLFTEGYGMFFQSLYTRIVFSTFLSGRDLFFQERVRHRVEGVLVAEFFTFALWYTGHKFPGILDCFGYGYTVESSPAKIPVSELLVVYTTVGHSINWNLCRIPDAAGFRARQIFNLAGYRK